MITPSLATFFITLINIGVLFFVMRAVLFKPVTKFMDERTRKIEETIAQAEKDKTRAKLLLKQYENQLKDAESEAEEIIRAARDTARQQADAILAEGHAASDQIIANARKQVEAEQEASLAKFRNEAAALVVAASAKLIARELNSDDNRRYAGLLLNELGKR